MPRISWYGPRYGANSTGDRVSHTERVAGAVRLKAMQIAHEAAFLLDSRAQHRTGDAQIRTQHWPSIGNDGSPLIDSIVYLVDPNNKAAALSIEEGHWSHGYSKRRNATLGDAEGAIRNGRDGDGGHSRWVEGLHVLRDAAK